jgi:uncharacterized low-complexity protein
VNSAARGRSGAPCSGVHGRRTERRLVSSVTVAALVCARKTAKSSASSTYVWRSTRRAAAAHSAARGRSGAPCSGVHGRRTERRLVSSVTVAALVCARKTAKSSASSTYVWRSTRRAAAAHSAARGRSGAPCSGVHGRRTERRLVSSVTVAALVCARKTAKSSASSTYVSTDIGTYIRTLIANRS